uniref:EF-hand domain-containing protein n=1 Tax=Astyanax mexicanus TaxID=7994 RepID=A0A3B1JEA9_ASTMX
MLACTEMITMCLQSAKREHLRSKQQQQLQQNHGLSIFHDIFRRADKNDDGKLSFEEFKAYFADGILTTDELQELFYSIDGRQANNLDTDKLSGRIISFCLPFIISCNRVMCVFYNVLEFKYYEVINDDHCIQMILFLILIHGCGILK